MSDNESFDNRGLSVEAEDLRARLKAAEDKIGELKTEIFNLETELGQVRGENDDLEDRVQRHGAIWRQLPEGDHFVQAMKSSRARALRQGNALEEEDRSPRYNEALEKFVRKTERTKRYKDDKKQEGRAGATNSGLPNANMPGKKHTIGDESESDFEPVKARKTSPGGRKRQTQPKKRGSRISSGNKSKISAVQNRMKTYLLNDGLDGFMTE
ncbi:hypothetical protein BKA65DRAFT_573410 [Rhexocercosporidium sp. MPI-PUGE-AT-0058]|nr:hypothetical protein BKA65DRAFT_573410 [Rhexocercosporidium sp. MPI-PUGE-AT-0058]